MAELKMIPFPYRSVEADCWVRSNSLGVVVLLGVELFGLTLLPGSQGLAVATVVDVPLGREADAESCWIR